MPEPLGWMAERERGGFIAGFQSGFAELNPSRFAIRPLHDPEPNLPVNRMNDGKPDAHGHIWRGTTDMAGGRETGALYRYSPDHECGRVDIGYGLPNGPAFSPGGCWLYHTDTGRRTIYRCARDETGRAMDRQVFIRFDEEEGYPDGITTDANGALSVAVGAAVASAVFRSRA